MVSRFPSLCKVLLLFIGVGSVIKFTEGLKCYVVAKLTDEKTKTLHECLDKTKPTMKKLPPMNTSIEQFDYDDNCFAQCTYKGVGALTSEGTLKPDVAPTLFNQGDLDATIIKQITTVWNDCIKSSDKIGKGKKFDECKILALQDHCFLSKLYGEDGALTKTC